jgi:hypothetical protein
VRFLHESVEIWNASDATTDFSAEAILKSDAYSERTTAAASLILKELTAARERIHFLCDDSAGELLERAAQAEELLDAVILEVSYFFLLYSLFLNHNFTVCSTV